MSGLSSNDLCQVADDIGAVTEAVLELHRKLAGDAAAQRAPSPKFAKLETLWARRRDGQPSVVANLAPDPIDVLDAVALALSDIEVLLRIPPQAESP